MLHLFVVVLLTILTQIGGIVYALALFSISKNRSRYRLKRSGVFLLIYLIATFAIVPLIAPYFGRERIKQSENVTLRNFGYALLNRNYARPELNEAVERIAAALSAKHPGVSIVCLDAGFPFYDGFPLLPHLSHDDGRKLDISLIYENPRGNVTNKKPSVSGYGVFEGPKGAETNQTEKCKARGHWQYDIAKFVTLGKINNDLVFSEKATRDLLQIIVRDPGIGKVFLEPHLRKRMGLSHPKLRFQGCHATRHDDHIHVQM